MGRKGLGGSRTLPCSPALIDRHRSEALGYHDVPTLPIPRLRLILPLLIWPMGHAPGQTIGCSDRRRQRHDDWLLPAHVSRHPPARAEPLLAARMLGIRVTKLSLGPQRRKNAIELGSVRVIAEERFGTAWWEWRRSCGHCSPSAGWLHGIRRGRAGPGMDRVGRAFCGGPMA